MRDEGKGRRGDAERGDRGRSDEEIW